MTETKTVTYPCTGCSTGVTDDRRGLCAGCEEEMGVSSYSWASMTTEAMAFDDYLASFEPRD